jgi:lysophospholipase L1-like esterase
VRFDLELRRIYGARAPYVQTRSLRNCTTFMGLNEWLEEFELKKVDYAIIQLGGGDAAPRFFLPWQVRWLTRLPFHGIRDFIFRLEKRWRHRLVVWFPNRVNVQPEIYRENIREFIRSARRCGLKGMVFINIPRVSDAFDAKLPGTQRRANQYNSILAQEAVGEGIYYIDLHSLIVNAGDPAELTVDGSHPGPYAQGFLVDKLVELFRELLPAEVSAPPERRVTWSDRSITI